MRINMVDNYCKLRLMGFCAKIFEILRKTYQVCANSTHELGANFALLQA